MNKDPFDYLQPYIVSLASPEKTPAGSGTLVRFSLSPESGIIVYAVLTATHVLDELCCLTACRDNKPTPTILLSKPVNRSGRVVAVRWAGLGIGTELDPKHYRHLKYFNKGIYARSERDVALLILAIGDLPSPDLISNSDFFDLENNPAELLIAQKNDPYVFYKGACLDDEEQNCALTNTGIHIVLHDGFKIGSKSGIQYIRFMPSNNNTLNGASGAGLWTFYRVEQGLDLNFILRGVIVEKKGKIRAIALSYVHEKLLPKVKLRIINNKTDQ